MNGPTPIDERIARLAARDPNDLELASVLKDLLDICSELLDRVDGLEDDAKAAGIWGSAPPRTASPV